MPFVFSPALMYESFLFRTTLNSSVCETRRFTWNIFGSFATLPWSKPWQVLFEEFSVVICIDIDNRHESHEIPYISYIVFWHAHDPNKRLWNLEILNYRYLWDAFPLHSLKGYLWGNLDNLTMIICKTLFVPYSFPEILAEFELFDLWERHCWICFIDFRAFLEIQKMWWLQLNDRKWILTLKLELFFF